MSALQVASPRGSELSGRFSRAAVFAGATLASAACSAPQDAPPATMTASTQTTSTTPPPSAFATPPPGRKDADVPPQPADAPPPPPADAPPPPPADAGVRNAVTGGGIHVALRDAATRKPITGIYIFMWPAKGEYRAEPTDATGTARFDGLAAGTHKIRAPKSIVIDGNGEIIAQGENDQQVRVTGTVVVQIDLQIPVTKTTAVRAPIPMPYGAPPARRRTV
jgi:hypothetical protein